MTGNAPWSIRRRLTRRVLAFVLLAWLATIGLAVLFLDYELDEMMDAELKSMAETTLLALDADPSGVIPRSIGIDPGDGERFLRVLRRGEVEPEAPWPALASDGFHRVGGWRVIRVSAENAVIEVAHNLSWRREEMLEAASAFVVLLLPLLGFLLWALGQSLRQGFAPLEALTEAISRRGAEDLSPVPGDGLPAEIGPLATGLNRYIGRIDDLRQSERRFVANASHELRTPIAAIRARIELSTDTEAREALPLLDGLSRRVERLLQLSRSEAGLGLGRGPADLVLILRLLLREIAPTARHQIRFDDGDHDQLIIAADPDAVAILLRNLIENAVEHGTGPVSLRLRGATVSILNPAEAGFETAPYAKRAGSAGLGIGLSIVRQLAEVMGASVETRFRGGHAVATVCFAPVIAGDLTPSRE